MSSQVIITGTIKLSESLKPLPNLRLEIWDGTVSPPSGSYGWLAGTTTDMSGSFTAIVNDPVASLVLTGTVTLKYRVYKGNVFIVENSFSDYVDPLSITVDQATLDLLFVATPPESDATTYITFAGKITDVNNHPIDEATINIYENGFREKILIASTVTDISGYYRVNLNVKTVSNTTVIAGRSIRVEAVDNSSPVNLLAASNNIFQWENKDVVNVDLQSSTVNNNSEFKKVVSAIQAVIGTTPAISSLTVDPATKTDEIKYVSGATGHDHTLINSIVSAHQYADASSVQPDLMYALVKSGGSDQHPLHYMKESQIRSAISDAMSNNVIKTYSGTDVDTFVGQARSYKVTQTKAISFTDEPHTLNDVLLSIFRTQPDVDNFLDAYHGDHETMDDFWTHYTTTYGAPAAQKAQMGIKLATITCFQPDIMTELFSEIGGSDISIVASWDNARWLSIISTVCTATGRLCVPVSIRGAETDPANTAIQQQYADKMAAICKSLYPLSHVNSQLSGSDGNLLVPDPEHRSSVINFLSNNPGFDVRANSIHDIKEGGDFNLTGVSDVNQLKTTLAPFQNLHRITANNPVAVCAMMKDGVNSAAAIVKMGLEGFMNAYGSYFPDQNATSSDFHAQIRSGEFESRVTSVSLSSSAVSTYVSAVAATSAATHAVTGALTGMAGLGTTAVGAASHALSGATYSAAPIVPPFFPGGVLASPTDDPRLSSLFGNLDYCNCSDCLSLYSPAAYLADTLHFLQNKEPATYNALVAKRPDLIHIDLSCKNTETPMPYIDLVIELLELQILNENPSVNIPGGVASNFSFQTSATQDELAAYPEHVYKTGGVYQDYTAFSSGVPYDNIYGSSNLAAAVYPGILPFNLAVEETRAYLSNYGISRYEMMKLFAPFHRSVTTSIPTNTITDFSLYAEWFGLTQIAATIVTGYYSFCSTTPYAFYGANNPTASFPNPDNPGTMLTGAWMTVLSSRIDLLLQQTNISYEELLQYLATDYLNPVSAITHAPDVSITTIVASPPYLANTCKLDELQLTFANTGAQTTFFDKFHRFIRLVKTNKLTIYEWDMLLRSMKVGNIDNNAFILIGRVMTLSEDLNISPITLSFLWNNVDTKQYFDYPNGNTNPLPTLYNTIFNDKGVVNNSAATNVFSNPASLPPYYQDTTLNITYFPQIANYCGITADEAMMLAGELRINMSSPVTVFSLGSLYTLSMLKKKWRINAINLQMLLAMCFDTASPPGTFFRSSPIASSADLSAFLDDFKKFVDYVDSIFESGFTIDEFLTVFFQIPDSVDSIKQEMAKIQQFYEKLRTSLLKNDNEDPTEDHAAEIRYNKLSSIVYEAFGKEFGLTTQWVADIFANNNPVNYQLSRLISPNFIRSTYSLSTDNLSNLDSANLLPGEAIPSPPYDPSDINNVAPFIYAMSIYDWYYYFSKISHITSKLLLRTKEFEYIFFNPQAVAFDFTALLPTGGTNYLGAIVSTTLSSGGTGYVAGEYFYVNGIVGSQAYGQILAVDMTGAVTKYVIIYHGSNHTVGTGIGTTLNTLGAPGSGFKLNITEVYSTSYTTISMAETMRGVLRLCRAITISRRFDFDEDQLGYFLNGLRGILTVTPPGILPPPPVITTSLYVPPSPISTSSPTYSTDITTCLGEAVSGMVTQIVDHHLQVPDMNPLQLLGATVSGTGVTTYTDPSGAVTNSLLNVMFSSDPAASDLAPNLYSNLSVFVNVADIMYWLSQIGLSAIAMHKLLVEDVTVSDTRALIVAARRHYDSGSWAAIAKPLRDKIRVKQRDALVAYTRVDPSALFADLLIDVEMDACMLTSRLKQAISSVQLFVDRVILGLERYGSPASSLSLDLDSVTQWKTWRKWYNIWQANREVFLYPENWMQPELRDDKSIFFLELEKQLKQDDVTPDKVNDAVLDYLQKLEEVAKLEPVGTCDEVTPEGQTITHAFCRTYGATKKYYHRILKEDVWYPWERVDIDIQSDHVMPCFWNGRLYLFWLTFKDKAAPFTAAMIADDVPSAGTGLRGYRDGFAGYGQEIKNTKWFYNDVTEYHSDNLNAGATDKKYKQLEITVHWSEYKKGEWKNLKVGKTPMLLKINPWIEWDINVKIAQSNPTEKQIFSHLMDNRQRTIMEFIKSRVCMYPHIPSASDVIATDYPATVVNGDLYLMIMFPTFGTGASNVHDEYATYMRSFHFSASTNSMEVTNDMFYNKLIPPKDLYFKNMRLVHYSPSGDLSFQKDDSYASSTMNFYRYYDETLQNISTVSRSAPNSLLNAGISDFNIYPQSKYYNPLEDKFFYEDRNNIFYARKVNYSSPTYSVVTTDLHGATRVSATYYGTTPDVLARGTSILLGPSVSITRRYFETFYHPHVNDFIHVLNRYGIDGLMRPDLLGLPTPPTVQTFTDTMNFSGVYNPASNVVALGDQYSYPTDMVNFTYGSPYACYNWELFFHIPMLMAQRLSENQQFEEARKWYHYIFDPTSHSYMDGGGSVPSQQYWKLKPFYDIAGGTIQTIEDLLTNINTGQTTAIQQVHQSGEDPFNTFAIGRIRPQSFMKWVFRKYLDNLIAWGDMLFTRDTIESINEATQLYILASNLLGKRPEEVPQRLQPPIYSYSEISSLVDDFGEASVAVESYTTPSILPATIATLTASPTTVAATAAAAGSGTSSGSATTATTRAAAGTSTASSSTAAAATAASSSTARTSTTTTTSTASTSSAATRTSSSALVSTGTAASVGSGSFGVSVGAGGSVSAGSFSSMSASSTSSGVTAGAASAGTATSGSSSVTRSAGSTSATTAATAATTVDVLPVATSATLPASAPRTAPVIPHVSYFCLSPNGNLFDYFDVVADRLFKIRHCENMQGAIQQLPLFDPPINPALLVQAAATGVDINNLLNDISGSNTPNYRFTYMLQKANEFCADVKALGGALLAALEKKDAEKLALLRQGQETNVLTAVLQLKKLQLDEANANMDALLVQRDNTQARFEYYSSRPYMNAREQAHLESMKVAMGLQIASGIVESTVTVMSLFPTFHLQGPMSVGPSDGGLQLANSFASLSSILSTGAAISNTVGSMAATSGGYDRRMDDWKFQAQSALKEIAQIDKQINAANIRIQIAQADYDNQQLQINNSIATDAFMRSKYTNSDLYDWMISQIAGTYFQAYQLALKMAKKAELCYKTELPLSNAAQTGIGFIEPSYWDSLRKGLQAGESLQYDLRNMESNYLLDNKRTLELTKHVSLAITNPDQLIQLRQSGSCTIYIPEAIYDLDYPTHFNRMVKSISISIPCVAGPYTTIPCKITHTDSYVRRTTPASDPLTRIANIPCSTIVTSSAQNDNGVFDFNFRDERYLPFEGAGAVCQLALQLGGLTAGGQNLKPFDFNTISDVIVHVKYTAVDGAEDRSANVWTTIQTGLYGSYGTSSIHLTRIFSLKHEFPNAWGSYANMPASPTMAINMNTAQFPFFASGRTITVKTWHILLKTKAAITSMPNSPATITLNKGTTTIGSAGLSSTTSTYPYYNIIVSGGSATDINPATDTLNVLFKDTTNAYVNMDNYCDDIILVALYTLS